MGVAHATVRRAWLVGGHEPQRVQGYRLEFANGTQLTDAEREVQGLYVVFEHNTVASTIKYQKVSEEAREWFLTSGDEPCEMTMSATYGIMVSNGSTVVLIDQDRNGDRLHLMSDWSDKTRVATLTVEEMMPEPEPEPVAAEPAVQCLATASDAHDSDEDGGKRMCTICCSPFEEGDNITRLPCNHIYHPRQNCLAGWVANGGSTCPQCRA